MKTVCIVQARMGSKRLPGKVLLPLNGHTVIGEVLTRCKRIPGVDEVVCAVPADQTNNVLATEACKYGRTIQGSGHNVLWRYLYTAQLTDADIIVRVTGDCPMISPELCGAVVNLQKTTGADYASNCYPRVVVSGLDCEVFTYELLERAHKEAVSPEDLEHVTPWMQRAKDIHVAVLNKVSLDTEEDYKFICAAFGHEPYQRILAV